MKKFLVLFVAVLLALPAMSYAGSATSRYDVTIGGMVKFDMGWSDQSVGGDAYYANRKGRGAYENAFDENGNFFALSGETRLNLLIKGPDTWGAKSSAFIEGDFRTANSYNAFRLRHAFMKFDWPTTSLLIGQTWQAFGLMPCFCVLNTNDLAPFMKGTREPQITLTKSFGKNFSLAMSISSPYESGNNGLRAGYEVDNYSLGEFPDFSSEFVWKTPGCGKIGPWMLQAGLGGVIGRSKYIYDGDALEGAYPPGPTGSTNGSGANVNASTDFSSEYATKWALTFKTFIPIIAEKKPGALAGSLGFAAVAFYGQNYETPYQPPGAYLSAYDRNGDMVSPKSWGGWAQIMYYLTDKVSANIQVAHLEYSASDAIKAANGNAIDQANHYIFNVMYDVNPAVRLGAQYSQVYTKYMGYPAASATAPAGSVSKSGRFNQVRVAAYYFF